MTTDESLDEPRNSPSPTGEQVQQAFAAQRAALTARNHTRGSATDAKPKDQRTSTLRIRPTQEQVQDLINKGMAEAVTAKQKAGLEAYLAPRRELAAQLAIARNEMVAQLHTRTDPVTTAMLEHHSPDNSGTNDPCCQGCDIDGYDAVQPEWPCSTIYALARVHGIPTPNL